MPEESDLGWLLIDAFLGNLGLISFSFSALLGLVSQNGIFLLDKIRIVSLLQDVLVSDTEKLDG